jgi:DHA1 family multidrug resistance protein-like MFS transporter
MAQSEIDQEQVSTLSIVYEALVIPWKINAFDPSVLFTTIYIALLYAIFYSFFEVFPIVYGGIYNMDLGSIGLVFLSVLIAVPLAAIPYFAHVHLVINARIKANMSVSPESRLVPALGASILNCAGLFVFGWTSRRDIYWVVPTIGIVMATAGQVVVFQNVLIYVAIAYPRYAASLFAMNDLCRSLLAFAAVLWSQSLFGTLGVGGGVSLLGGLMCCCVVGVFALWYFGAKLRARSRFSG